MVKVPEKAHLDENLHDARRCTYNREQIELSETRLMTRLYVVY